MQENQIGNAGQVGVVIATLNVAAFFGGPAVWLAPQSYGAFSTLVRINFPVRWFDGVVFFRESGCRSGRNVCGRAGDRHVNADHLLIHCQSGTQ